jgi:hypothetical protein
MLKPTCPKCQVAMDEGFVVDQNYATAAQAEWAEGQPETSIWTGVKLRGRERYKVATFRCPRCSYLESYAPAEQ